MTFLNTHFKKPSHFKATFRNPGTKRHWYPTPDTHAELDQVFGDEEIKKRCVDIKVRNDIYNKENHNVLEIKLQIKYKKQQKVEEKRRQR